MPMIDVYAGAGRLSQPHALAGRLAETLMRIEDVPRAAGVALNGGKAYVDGDSDYVRVQVLTNAGALDRAKQIAVVEQFVALVAEAAGDDSLRERTWVLLTEAVPGGWGLRGHAHTNDELIEAARAEIAERGGR